MASRVPSHDTALTNSHPTPQAASPGDIELQDLSAPPPDHHEAAAAPETSSQTQSSPAPVPSWRKRIMTPRYLILIFVAIGILVVAATSVLKRKDQPAHGGRFYTIARSSSTSTNVTHTMGHGFPWPKRMKNFFA
ncbi:hypothetical protein BDW02DRAFT_602017 [Decorospora gaudefroyi]|uniref:Uncharacterized protein n=1 Tax=Decorospora gaudefroyi TaxID=184978 RepID=A0A6A5K9K0_9PLEO|nr:hypothetical protein BDW02DRAFT_602017 [Decorospora gaudefroyi]